MFHVKHCVADRHRPQRGFRRITVILWSLSIHRSPSPGQATDPSIAPRRTPVPGAGCGDSPFDARPVTVEGGGLHSEIQQIRTR